jgi:cytochrome c biogenesis protein CcmG, thiol:disulfide interchange protein DsbE
MKRLIFVLPLVVFAAVATWLAIGLTRDPSLIPSALVDRPMPIFSLPALAGAGVPALGDADIKGQVALVNFFASWCVPCRIEHPILMRLAAENRVAVFGVNYKNDAGEAVAWLRNLGNPFRAIGYDREGKVAIDWGVYGVPETFVIDRQGRVRHRHVGPITARVLNETLAPLLAELAK